MTITGITAATSQPQATTSAQQDTAAAEATDGFAAALRDASPGTSRRTAADQRDPAQPARATGAMKASAAAGAGQSGAVEGAGANTGLYEPAPSDAASVALFASLRGASGQDASSTDSLDTLPRDGDDNSRRSSDAARAPEAGAPQQPAAMPLMLLALPPAAADGPAAIRGSRPDAVAPGAVRAADARGANPFADWSAAFGRAAPAAEPSEQAPAAASAWLATASQSDTGPAPRIPAAANLGAIEASIHHAPQAAPAARLEASMQQVAMKAAGDAKSLNAAASEAPRTGGTLDARRGLDGDMQPAEVRSAAASKVDAFVFQPVGRAERIDAASEPQAETLAPAASGTPVATQVADAIAAAAVAPGGSGAGARGTSPFTGAGSQVAHTAGMASAEPLQSQTGADEVVKSLRVKLHPVDLGQVDVRLSLHGDSLRVRLRLETPEAADALQSSKSELTQALSSHGLRLDGLAIDVIQVTRPADPRGPAPGTTNTQTFDTSAGSAGTGQSGRDNARRDARGEAGDAAAPAAERGTRDVQAPRRSTMFV